MNFFAHTTFAHLHVCTLSTLQVHKGKTHLKENVEIRGSERIFFKKKIRESQQENSKETGYPVEKERGRRK